MLRRRSLALMKRFAAVLAVLLLCLCAPYSALAQLGPQNVPAPLTQDDSEPETINLDEDSGFSTTQIVLTFGGAIAIISLIAWLIMRDARGKAAPQQRGRTASASGPGGATVAAAGVAPKKSAREREREQARKRNKAKAVRDQRKRNRPR